MNRPLLLLIDDSPDMDLVVHVLSKNVTVEVVHRSGITDGWVALQERPPALLLLDMRLGSGESGAELCRLVRAEPSLAQLRVALFTTLTQIADVHAGLAAGADLLFDKDLIVYPEDWRRRLTEILAWTRGRVWEKLVALKTDSPWPTPPQEWLAIFNQALRQALVRRVSTDLLRNLVQRAIDETITRSAVILDTRAWLHPTEAAFLDKKDLAGATPETIALLGASLAEQLWCLLGSRDSAFFTTALAPVVPCLTEAILI